MSATGKLLLTLLLATPGDPLTVADIPIIDHQAADFHGAIADKENVAVAWSVEPNPVAIDRDTVLSLIVRHAANPTELTRPNLRELTELTKHFQVEDLPNEPPEDGVATFRYQLRPRDLGEHTIPAIPYRYYRPHYPEGRRFQTTRPATVIVRVIPTATKPPSPAVPLTAPESFFALVPIDASSRIPRWAWLIPIAVLPVLVGIGIVIGRWLFPDAARRAALRRHRAVRVVLARLAQADTAAAVASVFLDYLIARHGLSRIATTPREVSADLLQMGWSPNHVTEAEALLRQCDEARYSPHSDNAVSLANRVASQIESWEGTVP